MAISKKLRFEVFKRDGFQCQYCGKQPPGIVLELDHILSRKRKGKDDFSNLITACFDCNRGKGAEDLKTAPESIKTKLGILKEKEFQLKEFYRYQNKIQRMIEKNLDLLNKKWAFFHDNKYELSEHGRLKMKNLLRNFTRIDIEEAIEIAFEKPYIEDKDKFSYMCGVLWTKKRQREKGE